MNIADWESLEKRVLLSASIVSGILEARGTNANDTIVLDRNPVDNTKLRITINGHAASFAAASVTSVKLSGRGGEDDITVDESNGLIGKPVKAYGGASSDAITGASGNDKFFGGGGSDTLEGGDGNDYLSGGRQDDTLVGGDGNDTLMGGFGNDSLLGEAGNDRIKGGAGEDHLDGGAGTDVLTGGPDLDVFDTIAESSENTDFGFI
jgi:Ca2+-binding RTX toxin-like protein